LAGFRARGASKKNWDPYLFLQPLKLATSNLVYNLGFGGSLPRNNFYDQNWRGSELGERPKNFGTPYLFLQPLKLSTSNLVYNLRLGNSLLRNNFPLIKEKDKLLHYSSHYQPKHTRKQQHIAHFAILAPRCGQRHRVSKSLYKRGLEMRSPGLFTPWLRSFKVIENGTI